MNILDAQALRRLIPWTVEQQARATRKRWIACNLRRARKRFYRQFVSRGELCFDIGANMGNRTSVLLGLGARVVAVEPQQHCAVVLQESFGQDPHFSLVSNALGREPGHTKMMISNAHTLSSLSESWIRKVRESGRFAEYQWQEEQVVEITTLDALIREFGRPVFVKCDVEGYESEVLAGLSEPVPTVSIEFIPEFLDSTFACLDHLSSLGEIRVNCSLGESMQLEFDQWRTPAQIRAWLNGLRGDAEVFGDLYMRTDGI